MIKGLTLNPRDKTALLMGGAALTVMLLVGGGVAASVAFRQLDRTIASRSAALRDIARLRGEVHLLQQQIRQAEAKLGRSPDGSLVTVVEGLANRVAGQGSLAYLRPLAVSAQDGVQVETLELKLERQSLEQLLRLLWEVENNPAAPMRIASLRLQRRFENHALLDATMTMNVYRK